MEEIRTATKGDIEEVYKLICELENSIMDKDKFKTIYDINLLNPHVYYFVYEMNYTIVGFISLHIQQLLHHSSNIAEIQE